MFFLLFLLLTAAGLYGGAAYYFSQHFYSGSVINGMDCSNLTVDQVKARIVNEIHQYALTIEQVDGARESIQAEQIDLEYIDDNKVEELMRNQNPLLWIAYFSKNKAFEMTANTSHDEQLLKDAMNKLKCFDKNNITEPKDAYVSETEVNFEIIPEVTGNQLKEDQSKELIKAAITSGKTTLSLVEEECYIKPTVYQDQQELVQKRDSLNQIAATSITYDFGNGNTEVINWPLIKTWIGKDANGEYLKDENGNYAVNMEQVKQCIEGLAAKYDTYHNDSFEFQTRNIGTVKLPKGNYGWQLDQEKMAADLLSSIVNLMVETKEPSYLKTGNGHENQGLGNTYVEVSIKEQHMWCYKDGELIVDTPVVTGNVANGWDTPSGGVWTIFMHTSPYTLRGEVKEDGKPEYEVPVKYWMPFNNGVGIHDIGRGAWGGSIYKTSGSHGCVNTPKDAAKKIYEAVEIGTPVVVY